VNGPQKKRNPRVGAGFEIGNAGNGNAEVPAKDTTTLFVGQWAKPGDYSEKHLDGGAVAWHRPEGITVDDMLGKPDCYRIYAETEDKAGTRLSGQFHIRLPNTNAVSATADQLTADPNMYSYFPPRVADYLRRLVARFHAERALANLGHGS
jgi:hypothetical protein